MSIHFQTAMSRDAVMSPLYSSSSNRGERKNAYEMEVINSMGSDQVEGQ